jgi:hypothetical protein
VNGAAYLRSRVDEVIDRAADEHGVTVEDRAWINGLCDGLLTAGLINLADAQPILARLDNPNPRPASESLTVTAPAPPFSVEQRLSMLRASDAGQPAPPPADAVVHEPSKFLRFVSLAGRQAAGTAAASFISLDVWTTFLCLRVVYPHASKMSPQQRRSDHRDRVLGHQRWDAHDDHGDRYREIGVDWIDVRDLLIESRLFEPSPTAHATALHVRTDLPGQPAVVTLPLY